MASRPRRGRNVRGVRHAARPDCLDERIGSCRERRLLELCTVLLAQAHDLLLEFLDPPPQEVLLPRLLEEGRMSLKNRFAACASGTASRLSAVPSARVNSRCPTWERTSAGTAMRNPNASPRR